MNRNVISYSAVSNSSGPNKPPRTTSIRLCGPVPLLLLKCSGVDLGEAARPPWRGYTITHTGLLRGVFRRYPCNQSGARCDRASVIFTLERSWRIPTRFCRYDDNVDCSICNYLWITPQHSYLHYGQTRLTDSYAYFSNYFRNKKVLSVEWGVGPKHPQSLAKWSGDLRNGKPRGQDHIESPPLFPLNNYDRTPRQPPDAGKKRT